MIGASQCGERNTVPTATDRSMNMSEKEMFNVGKIINNLVNPQFIFLKIDSI